MCFWTEIVKHVPSVWSTGFNLALVVDNTVRVHSGYGYLNNYAIYIDFKQFLFVWSALLYYCNINKIMET